VKICPVVTELLHADRQNEGRTDGRADMTKLIMTFHNFAKAPKNCKMLGGYSIVWKERSTAIMTVERLRNHS